MLVQTKFDYFSMKSKQCWEAASPNEFVSLYRLGPLHSSRCLAHAKVEPGHPDSWKTKVSGNMQYNFTTASLQTVAQPLLPLISHCLLLCFPISNSQDLNPSTEGRLQNGREVNFGILFVFFWIFFVFWVSHVFSFFFWYFPFMLLDFPVNSDVFFTFVLFFLAVPCVSYFLGFFVSSCCSWKRCGGERSHP